MAQATGGLRERAKAARRQRIYEAVLAILCEEGLAGLTTARIAARCGLSVATLYNLIGGLDTLVDGLVGQLFDGLEASLADAAPGDGPAAAVLVYIDATYRYLAARETELRAVQRAIFQRSLNHGASNPVLAVAARSGDHLAAAIGALRRAGTLDAAVDPRLLAEQMVLGLSILLQNWSVGLMSLERCRRATRYQFLMLLRAWATPAGAAALDAALRAQQAELAALPARRNRQSQPRRPAAR